MKPHKIERLYAWIGTDPEDGEEGIPAVHTSDGMLPMIGSDRERIESFRRYAEALIPTHGPVRLVEFTGMVVLETLE